MLAYRVSYCYEWMAVKVQYIDLALFTYSNGFSVIAIAFVPKICMLSSGSCS
ncbi:UNVERIFIED_ORG: hypothetical protein EC838_3229 [Providencia alcalifaciens]|uniref:Uncharacterized protein n=1 Tax=Providencia rettgeri TaxID=587 RepID=A0A379FPH8_PRORE|nr:Uncharacterised protein [Providencia rettgeri]